MIPMTDSCSLVPPMAIDPDTGDRVLGQPIPTVCRVQYTSQTVRSMTGDMVVAMAKIYFPADNLINASFKIDLDDKIHSILKVEQKKDLSGRTNHYVVYV